MKHRISTVLGSKGKIEKALGQEPPPSGLVDKINAPGVPANGSLDEIKLDWVYLYSGRFYRPIGWLGTNNVVIEEVKVHPTNQGFNFFWRARRVKGRQVYQETLDEFAKRYKVPTPEELIKFGND